jgi:hypothetical protein
LREPLETGQVRIVRAAHAALECVPEPTPLHECGVPQRRRAARSSRIAASPPRANQSRRVQAGRHGDRRPPPASVAEQVCHPQQRTEEAGACPRACPALRPAAWQRCSPSLAGSAVLAPSRQDVGMRRMC